MTSKSNSYFFIFLLISLTLIIQTSSQLTFNFVVKDIEIPKKNTNLRSNLELPMNSEVDTKTIMNA